METSFEDAPRAPLSREHDHIYSVDEFNELHNGNLRSVFKRAEKKYGNLPGADEFNDLLVLAKTAYKKGEVAPNELDFFTDFQFPNKSRFFFLGDLETRGFAYVIILRESDGQRLLEFGKVGLKERFKWDSDTDFALTYGV